MARAIPWVTSLWLSLGACTPLGVTAPARQARSNAPFALPPMTYPFEVSGSVPRTGGGAFVLGDGGQLARLDRYGVVSGIYATDLRSLFRVGRHVCGSTASNLIYCVIDHHEDLSCRVDPPAPAVVPLRGELGLAPHQRADSLCDARGACFHVQASCERHCLAFPACAPARCIDPCPNGEGPSMRLIPIPDEIFLAEGPPAVTDGQHDCSRCSADDREGRRFAGFPRAAKSGSLPFKQIAETQQSAERVRAAENWEQ